MKKDNKQPQHDEFEKLDDQIQTYPLKMHIQKSITLQNHKKNNNNSEKHKLELIKTQPQMKFFEIYERKTRKSQTKTSGKIITIGKVIFKSNFESGSFGSIEQIGSHMYKITLDKQTNSLRTCSWFHFTVEGLKGQVTFIISGFTKTTSLYNHGMKICYKDTKQLSKWRRGCSRISYYQKQQDNLDQTHIYELQFSHFFKNNEYSCVQFAYSFPYSVKKLESLINSLRDHIEYQSLGQTFSGRPIPLLTIGNKNSEKIIIVSARVHPGQSVSSFVMEGFLRELVSDNEYGKQLRSNFLFKIIPMVNPDGVAQGNYRFSAAGFDLNRKWKTSTSKYHPEIEQIKNMIKGIKDKIIYMFIDIHGHSRKKNVFFYGCPSYNQNPSQPKLFPYFMQKVYDAFKFENCSFCAQKQKQGTARLFMWKQMKVTYAYTLQCSFCGSQNGLNYLQNDYQKIGKKLCEGMAIFFYDQEKPIPSNIQFGKMLSLKNRSHKEIQQNLYLSNFQDNSDIVGSDSEPQNGEISQRQRENQTNVSISLGNRTIKKINQKNEMKLIEGSRSRFNNRIKSEASIIKQLNEVHMNLNKVDNFQTLKPQKSEFFLSSEHAKFQRIKIAKRLSHSRNSGNRTIKKIPIQIKQTEKIQTISPHFHITKLSYRLGPRVGVEDFSCNLSSLKPILFQPSPNLISNTKQAQQILYPITHQRRLKTSTNSNIRHEIKVEKQGRKITINGDKMLARSIKI